MVGKEMHIGNESIGIRGDLKITSRYIETGEIIDEFDDTNVVLTQGKQELIKAFTIRDTNDHSIDTVVIGSDVGTGTVMEPQEASPSFSENTQTLVYRVPPEEFFIEYPTSTSVRFTATINGANVMLNYPNQPNVIYTSASLRLFNDKAITYKRFGARTISSLISVDVSWTITFT